MAQMMTMMDGSMMRMSTASVKVTSSVPVTLPVTMDQMMTLTDLSMQKTQNV